MSKCLDRRLTLGGFEVLDLLAVFLVLSVLNFLFGASSLKLFLVWLPSLALAMLLRWGKRDKPENYLVHWLRFQVRPGVYSAFADASAWELPPTRRPEVIRGA